MNWLTAVCTWIWITKERFKAWRLRRRIDRDVNRVARKVAASKKAD